MYIIISVCGKIVKIRPTNWLFEIFEIYKNFNFEMKILNFWKITKVALEFINNLQNPDLEMEEKKSVIRTIIFVGHSVLREDNLLSFLFISFLKK